MAIRSSAGVRKGPMNTCAAAPPWCRWLNPPSPSITASAWLDAWIPAPSEATPITSSARAKPRCASTCPLSLISSTSLSPASRAKRSTGAASVPTNWARSPRLIPAPRPPWRPPAGPAPRSPSARPPPPAAGRPAAAARRRRAAPPRPRPAPAARRRTRPPSSDFVARRKMEATSAATAAPGTPTIRSSSTISPSSSATIMEPRTPGTRLTWPSSSP